MPATTRHAVVRGRGDGASGNMQAHEGAWRSARREQRCKGASSDSKLGWRKVWPYGRPTASLPHARNRAAHCNTPPARGGCHHARRRLQHQQLQRLTQGRSGVAPGQARKRPPAMPKSHTHTTHSHMLPSVRGRSAWPARRLLPFKQSPRHATATRRSRAAWAPGKMHFLWVYVQGTATAAEPQGIRGQVSGRLRTWPSRSRCVVLINPHTAQDAVQHSKNGIGHE